MQSCWNGWGRAVQTLPQSPATRFRGALSVLGLKWVKSGSTCPQPRYARGGNPRWDQHSGPKRQGDADVTLGVRNQPIQRHLKPETDRTRRVHNAAGLRRRRLLELIGVVGDSPDARMTQVEPELVVRESSNQRFQAIG